MRLNERQIAVLRWIAEGCPERDWPDWTHRSSAKVLQSRGLVKVHGRGAAWKALVTEHGRRVLSGDEDASALRATREPSSRKALTTTGGAAKRAADSSAPPVDINPADLVAELTRAAGNVIRVSDPEPATRSGYRRALAAIPPNLLPDGKRVTYSGRDRGDLVIRYAALLEPVSLGPSVIVPDELESERPLVTWIASHPDAVDVGPDSRERALRIIQGIENALSTLGHTVSTPRAAAPDEEQLPTRFSSSTRTTGGLSVPVSFEVTVGEQVLQVSLFEEKSKVHAIPEEEAAKLKYDWQRATSVETWRFNGRLALQIHGHAPKQGWADRQRWTLESRLPRFVAALVEVAEARTEARQRALEAQRERRRQWEEAVPKARAAYLSELNQARLTTQLDAFTAAQQLRGYADAVTARAADLEGEEQKAALAWADWIRADANRRDPALQDDTLRFVEPVEIRSWELDKYMPRGWSVAGPPD